MRAQDLEIVIPELLKLEIPIVLYGATGIGKSDIFKQIAQNLNWDFARLYLAPMEQGDLQGLPYIEKDITKYATPHWFPTDKRIAQKEFGPQGIIVLEEFNRVIREVRQSIIEFTRDRTIAGRPLAKAWRIVGAINPPTEEYDVDEIDKALTGRCIWLKFDPDVDSWIKWAEKNKIDKRIISFALNQRDFLEWEEKGNNWHPNPKCTFRSLEYVDYIIKNCQIPFNLLEEIFQGIVGITAAIPLINELRRKSEYPVLPHDILENYPKETNIKIKNFILNNRQDLLNQTIRLLVKEIAKINKESGNFSSLMPYQLENMGHFILDLNKELQFTFVALLTERNLTDILIHIEKASKNGEIFFKNLLQLKKESLSVI